MCGALWDIAAPFLSGVTIFRQAKILLCRDLTGRLILMILNPEKLVKPVVLLLLIAPSV